MVKISLAWDGGYNYLIMQVIIRSRGGAGLTRRAADRKSTADKSPTLRPASAAKDRCYGPSPLFGGIHVLHSHPSIRLLPKLITQLVPAALVTVVGLLLLGNLAKAPDTTPATAAVPTAIAAEAVFTATPRASTEADEQPAKAAATRAAVKPKPAAANAPTPPRKPVEEAPRQVASAPPLPIVQVPEQPQAPARDETMMGKLWNTGTAVLRMPQQAAQSVTGWFAAATPPRPPAPIPTQNFQASM